jgi:hypothetical protein
METPSLLEIKKGIKKYFLLKKFSKSIWLHFIVHIWAIIESLMFIYLKGHGDDSKGVQSAK